MTPQMEAVCTWTSLLCVIGHQLFRGLIEANLLVCLAYIQLWQGSFPRKLSKQILNHRQWIHSWRCILMICLKPSQMQTGWLWFRTALWELSTLNTAQVSVYLLLPAHSSSTSALRSYSTWRALQNFILTHPHGLWLYRLSWWTPPPSALAPFAIGKHVLCEYYASLTIENS